MITAIITCTPSEIDEDVHFILSPALKTMNTVTIKKVVYGGWGLAYHEGKTIFIPYTAPGDQVEVSIVRKKKNCLFGRVERIIEPSPERREPECPVFGKCGGCHFLHLSYENEVKMKKQTVMENLERIGKIKTAVSEFIPSRHRYGYRNHSVFKVNEEGRAGFAMRESAEIVPFPADGCLLLPPEMREAIAAIPRESFLPTREVRVRMDRFSSVHFWGLADQVGPPDTLMESGGWLFPVSPGSFFQVNRYMNDELMSLVVSLPSKIRRKLLDIYCGVGFFTLPLSRIVMEGMGVELNRAAVRNAQAAARLNKVTNVQFKRGTIEREIQRIRDVDLVTADPPRTGIPKQVLSHIIRLRPKELIMVSCEPPTFARDAAVLIDAGYILSAINLIDLFPGTFHVETVALFRRS